MLKAGGFYHVYNIGNNRETIFKEDCNYDFFQYRATVAYIHYNPVKARLCEDYDNWEYSSFSYLKKQLIGFANPYRTLQQFGSLEEFLNFHDLYSSSRNPDL